MPLILTRPICKIGIACYSYFCEIDTLGVSSPKPPWMSTTWCRRHSSRCSNMGLIRRSSMSVQRPHVHGIRFGKREYGFVRVTARRSWIVSPPTGFPGSFGTEAPAPVQTRSCLLSVSVYRGVHHRIRYTGQHAGAGRARPTRFVEDVSAGVQFRVSLHLPACWTCIPVDTLFSWFSLQPCAVPVRSLFQRTACSADKTNID